MVLRSQCDRDGNGEEKMLSALITLKVWGFVAEFWFHFTWHWRLQNVEFFSMPSVLTDQLLSRGPQVMATVLADFGAVSSII